MRGAIPRCCCDRNRISVACGLLAAGRYRGLAPAKQNQARHKREQC